jgi:vacuolar-type H+-ATPase subunit E/Vma4
MALTDLLRTLEREATARADIRLAEARAEAERLTAAHAAELAAHREQALAARARQLRSEGERGVVAATRDAERIRLLAQHELLDRVHDRARLNLVQHAGTTGGRAAVAGLLSRAKTYLGDAAATARVIPQPTGTRVAALDDSVEVDATLAGVLERLWPGLAMEIVRQTESLR